MHKLKKMKTKLNKRCYVKLKSLYCFRLGNEDVIVYVHNNQDKAKHNIFKSLSSSKACIVLDLAMKMLPKYREDTQDWFGKGDISCYIVVVLDKIAEVLQNLTYLHVFDGQMRQDATVILNVVAIVQKQFPELRNISL